MTQSQLLYAYRVVAGAQAASNYATGVLATSGPHDATVPVMKAATGMAATRAVTAAARNQMARVVTEVATHAVAGITFA